MAYASTLLVLIVAIGGITLAVAVLTRLASYRAGAMSPAPASSHESSSYDASHYAPMVHLLDSSEIQFLQTQQGITTAEISKFRQDRRLIFREYLTELASDFQRLHAQARAMVANAPEEHSAMVGLLFRQQVNFWRALALIECKLAFDGFGVRNISPQSVIDLVSSCDLALQVNAGPSLA